MLIDDSFIFIVKKVQKIRSFSLGLAAQGGGASKSSVPYNQCSRDCFSRGTSNCDKHKPTKRRVIKNLNLKMCIVQVQVTSKLSAKL